MKLRLLSFIGLSVLALGTLPAHADVSAPFLVEDVNPQQFIVGPTGVIKVVELADTSLLVLEGSDHESRETVLWRTDGTGDGTTPVPVPDIEVVTSVHGPMANATKAVLFTRSTDPRTAALYATDGTTAGTVELFSDARLFNSRYRPGADAVDFVRHLTGLSDLWRTDGTVAGTRRLGSFPFEGGDGLALGPEAGPWAYFLDRGRLHRTDGTDAGTRRVGPDVEIHESSTVSVFAFGERAAFITDGLNEVWATDGTDAGTRRVFEATGNERVRFDSPTASGDRLYFATHEGFTRRLWVTDGTPAGTRRLAELTTSFLSGIPLELLPFNAFAPFGQHSLLFVGNTDAAGIEPWVSDGTVAGTRLLADLCDGPCHSLPGELSGTGVDAFFSADDGVRGRELYRTTGATATILGDLCAGPCSSEPSVAGHAAGELYFFAADVMEERELYHSKAGGALAAPLTAFELREPFPGTLFHPTFLTERGLYFTAFTREGATVFRADGPSRTVDALMKSPGKFSPVDGSPSGFAAWQGNLFFVALSPEFDLTLYRKTPGELSQPLDVLVEDVRSFSSDDDAHESHVVGNLLFVLVNDGGFRGMWEELWVSDGTVGGATRLASELEIQAAWATDDRLYFLSRVDGRYDLWVSDGSVAATTRLREGIAEERFGTVPRLLATPFDGDLLYTTGIDL